MAIRPGTRVLVNSLYPSDEFLAKGRTGTVLSNDTIGYDWEVQIDNPPAGSQNPFLFYSDELDIIGQPE
jgi:hypothetical protein